MAESEFRGWQLIAKDLDGVSNFIEIDLENRVGQVFISLDLFEGFLEEEFLKFQIHSRGGVKADQARVKNNFRPDSLRYRCPAGRESPCNSA